MEYTQVLVSEEPGIGIVTLNRPERLNAWTWRLTSEMDHAIRAFDARDDIRAIVVTGAGRAFCAGVDFESAGDAFASIGADVSEGRSATRETGAPPPVPYWKLPTPIIAAMNGSAVGVGMTMVMPFDIRVVAEDGKYGFVFTRRGVIPELGANWLVPRLVGMSRALELLLTGRLARGEELARIGLAVAALPAEEVLPYALGIARDIATNVAPLPASIVKRLVYAAAETDDRAAVERLETLAMRDLFTSADASEGPLAFVERRAPNWTSSKREGFPEHLFE